MDEPYGMDGVELSYCICGKFRYMDTNESQKLDPHAREAHGIPGDDSIAGSPHIQLYFVCIYRTTIEFDTIPLNEKSS